MIATSHNHDHSCHDHGHDHEGHGHSHEIAADADYRKLGIVLLLLLGYMVVEIVYGIFAHSMALIADAGHMLTDAGAIALSMVAIRLTKRLVTDSATYGFARAKIASAMINGATLVIMAIAIGYESVHRLISPPTVHGGTVIWVAIIGGLVNVIVVRMLASANREDLNVEGAYQHMAMDLYASIGTVFAGLVIAVTGFDRIDPVASLIVAYLMFRSGIPLVKASGRIFMQFAPDGITAEVRAELEAHPDIRRVDDLHVWTLASGEHVMSAHITVENGVDGSVVCRALKTMASEKYGLHSTLQPHALPGREAAQNR